MTQCVEAQKGTLIADHPAYRNNHEMLTQWESESGDAEV